MSKEPIKKDEHEAAKPKVQSPADPEAVEDKYHGYTPHQVQMMEASRDPAPAVPSAESAAIKPAPKPEDEAKRKHDEEEAKRKQDDDDDEEKAKGKKK